MRLNLEQLEDRSVPTTTAVFSGGLLSVVGDSRDNAISVQADPVGNLSVTDNGVSIPIKGAPSLSQVTAISIDGKAGNDNLFVDVSVNTNDAGGLAFAPKISLFGGSGNDTLNSRAGGIVGGLSGVVNGVVVGLVVGNAYYDGGPGDDLLISGPGNDIIYGGQGNDTYRWPPGTLTDSFIGGPGLDTAVILGNSNQGDLFTLTGVGGTTVFQRQNLIQFTVVSDAENWVLNPGSGDDTVVINNLTFTGVRSVTVDGGDGFDTLFLNNPGVSVTFLNFEA